VAEERGLPLVPVRAAFEDRLARGVPPEQLFIPDMHCSDQGNALVAERIHRGLVELGLLGG
jgi:lysophospholipase L1-like esterase